LSGRLFSISAVLFVGLNNGRTKCKTTEFNVSHSDHRARNDRNKKWRRIFLFVILVQNEKHTLSENAFNNHPCITKVDNNVNSSSNNDINKK